MCYCVFMRERERERAQLAKSLDLIGKEKSRERKPRERVGK